MNPTIELVRAIDKRVRALATYVPDNKLKDSWTSYVEQVKAGHHFEGDCDDWAQTALHLAYDSGIPKDCLFRVLVSTTGDEIDHMIGMVFLPGPGEYWTIGDTFGPPQRVRGDKAGTHTIIQSSRMSEGLKWRFWGKSRMQRTTNTAANGMAISQKGIDFIADHEKFMARAYDDFRPNYVLKAGDRVQGTLTIGFGHTGNDFKIGDVWTRAKANRVLDQDLDRFEAAVRKMVLVPLTQNQFDALVSFCFNCGEGNLRSSTLLKKINQRCPVADIQAQFRRWNRSKGKVLNGLVKRRDAEARMWAGQSISTAAPLKEASVAVGASPLVDETKSAVKSTDVWALLSIVTVSMLSQAQEAIQGFRATAQDLGVEWLIDSSGIMLAGVSGLLLFKRLKEIVVDAKR